jgi:alginate O-acetyltransferase complex protein AlgI
VVFSSLAFLGYFLPIFLLVYSIIRKRFRNIFILLASIFFYSWGEPKFVLVILVSTIIDFYIVRKLAISNGRNKKLLLALSIFINLGLLLYFKYSNFFIENTNLLLESLSINAISFSKITLPIGISFYTFQTLTYSIDVYRGNEKPLKFLPDYLLYIMSFPQMIAGPIVRYGDVAKQIIKREYTASDQLVGFYRFAIGLAKKVLIANVMGEYADSIISDDFESQGTITLWFGILAYTFQIYFDFSGYSDMAIGLGKMMGFKFPENFESPYASKSITEFWRRWHITLGAFMRDYLYIPLGGSKVDSVWRLYFNLWFVFLVSGLWHGASWSFVLWGAYHGLFLVLERAFLLKIYKKTPNIFRVLTTFFIVVIGWVFFRIEKIDLAFDYLTKLFDFSSCSLPSINNQTNIMFYVAIFFSFFTLLPIGKKVQSYFFDRSSYSSFEHVTLFILSIFLFLLCLSVLTASGFNPFIYFRF